MLVYQVAIRLALAVLVGGLIGYEREFKNRPAGFRTHILVCLGAAITSMIQLYSIQETTNMILQHPELQSAMKVDIGRLGAQVITGVGFLGAGTIIHDKGSIKGLTTAASIWTVACIGLAIGLGYYTLTILSAICVFIVLVFLKTFENKLFKNTNVLKLEIQYVNKKDMVEKLEKYFDSVSIKVKNIEFVIDDEEDENETSKYSTTMYTILAPRYIKSSGIVQKLCAFEEIYKAEIM
ncbi:MgtC/SapB family protein [Clostridium estertheticum]|uniref:Methyltransferase n=2 Tax=Clostridium estertheticum TaxID=238834 RepID=A0A1J0GLK5_9CLOT|nr:MgtC/SapB family protein [Clostridium estertheticum]APC41774.1 methyltransferase [Clostridium estertheticum subsp. estertheticum]MBU3073389.1 MgtC/SapB family protein [Clostridium estertheticum]MBU3163370.1 MgtC/SapB family protein [Clostridium estertheticum]MBU3171543.1 MgtC/SapB family protein [Clostridium estertheticum]MBU3185379.1 MgtC/SapB family protein [Clostridium estertheticum]